MSSGYPRLTHKTRSSLGLPPCWRIVFHILKIAGDSMQHVLMLLRIYIGALAQDEQAHIVDALRSLFPDLPPAISRMVVTEMSKPERRSAIP